MVNFKVLSATLLSLILAFSCLQRASAEDSPTAPPAATSSAFVDLDGDGFDDNALDLNGDGIPDESSAKAPAAAQPEADKGGMFSSLELVVSKRPAFLHNSGSFGYCRGRSLSLAQHRGGFGSGSDFGPGNDIGSGAVLGGTCAGGVCSPH